MSKKECPIIVGLKFYVKSKEAIKSINGILEKKNTVMWLTGLGQLLLIFAGLGVNAKSGGSAIEKTHIFKVVSSDTSQTSYNVNSVNWEYFFKSFTAIDKFASNQIETIAGLQILRGGGITNQERKFWKAVHYGCKLK